MTKLKFVFWLTLVYCSVACQAPTARDAQGGVALTTQTISEAVFAECQNTVPDGPCKATSRITTAQKQAIKAQLRDVNKAQDVATTLFADGDITGALKSLDAAHKILVALEQLLAERGVQ